MEIENSEEIKKNQHLKDYFVYGYTDFYQMRKKKRNNFL